MMTAIQCLDKYEISVLVALYLGRASSTWKYLYVLYA